ncbi:hypothetical protein G7046_g3257 [Stylonectria norvegica]|nr:hypothetical protein G7046_g3257 [Stylonectria norvegica]
MALDRIVSLVLRAAELVFAAIVAGVTGEYLHKSNADSWALGRFIYTEVVAGLSIFLALLWLIPFSATFIHWPLDIFISILWWVVFGLLVDHVMFGSIDREQLRRRLRLVQRAPRGDQCGKFKADIAFAFLSALLWLVSALVGFFWVRKRERVAARADAAHARRRRWQEWAGRIAATSHSPPNVSRPHAAHLRHQAFKPQAARHKTSFRPPITKEPRRLLHTNALGVASVRLLPPKLTHLLLTYDAVTFFVILGFEQEMAGNRRVAQWQPGSHTLGSP